MTTPDVTQEKATDAPAAGFKSLGRLGGVAFDDLSRWIKREAYDVDYVLLEDYTDGRMWVSRHGWNHLAHLNPTKWYADDQLRSRGVRLSGGSGAVYRVSSRPAGRRPIDLVVKFSRVGQPLHLDVSSTFPGKLPRHHLDSAIFNDPFQEFGLLEELRNSQFGPSNLRILTKRPLAIYSPGKRFKAWQLGRREDLFQRHRYRLVSDSGEQFSPHESIDLSMDRQYIMLFHWVRGADAQELVQRGLLSSSEATCLVHDVIGDLSEKGFRVLDTKPNHVILRTRPDGSLLRHRGRLVYALVDFELLQRTEAYERWRGDDAPR